MKENSLQPKVCDAVGGQNNPFEALTRQL
jgi:hypothetical protein